MGTKIRNVEVMELEVKKNNFPQGLRSKISFLSLRYGMRIAIAFGGASIVAWIGSYPTYNVLEFDSNVMVCRLASVAHHYYVGTFSLLVGGVCFSIFGFIYCESEAKTLGDKEELMPWSSVMLGYWLLAGAVFLYLIAIFNMSSFVGHSSQPALMSLARPLDGYICPPPGVKNTP